MAIEKFLSRVGIGMYRMCLGNKLNEIALFKALIKETDINVIDTSTNYCDGESESLIGKALTRSNNKLLSQYQNQMLDRISQSNGRSNSQGANIILGISSNSFPLAEDNKHFLPFYDLIDRAKEASKRVITAVHQMPANLLERYGLTAAKWAKTKRIKNGAFSLASYPKANYETIKSSTVSYLKTLSQERVSMSIHSILELIKRVDNRLPIIKIGVVDVVLMGMTRQKYFDFVKE
ncbi:hypothetical protein C1646_757222 [Rhizophagus diaphanus]|nr:hypothetical protein C1646_757222 [Rhizophagus diaphanus] [Rhizophagus sp. MUCL 43196]